MVHDFLSQCQQSLEGNYPLVLVLFLGGLSGSLVHCLGMCSGFVLAQTNPQSKSITQKYALSYHLGRLITYMALGLVAGAAFSLLIGSPVLDMARRLILALVASYFLYLLFEDWLARLGIRLPFGLKQGLGCPLNSKKSHGFILGLGLGLLPCGLVYAALMSAATTANPLTAALGMAAFGLGTVPALLTLSHFGAALLKTWPKMKEWTRLGALGFNAVILLQLSLH
jgi:sulfite exporter TauE/SafE